jgi:hypothetical protein
MEQRWDDTNKGKPKDSERNLSQYHSVHHKSCWSELGAYPGFRGKKPATRFLSYGMANIFHTDIYINDTDVH